MSVNTNTYTLSLQPYLDRYTQCYKNIITINLMPIGPLHKFVHKINMPWLSKFQQESSCYRSRNCCLAIKSFHDNSEYMMEYDIPDLFSYLVANGYKIDTSLTKMMNMSEIQMSNESKLLCFITYIK
jgi:hypothetical protein